MSREGHSQVAEFSVADSEVGKRIDIVVNQRLELGRRAVGRLFSDGDVRIDAVRVKKGTLVRAGQKVSVTLPPSDCAAPAPDLSVHLALVRPDLVVADKPPGLPTAAIRNSQTDTLAGAVVAKFPEMSSIGFGPLEPGLVHRLDTFTSGLVVFARSTSSFKALRQALTSGQLTKRYLAVVSPDNTTIEGRIDANLEPHPKNKRKVLVTPPDSMRGRPASVEVRIVESRATRALLELSVGPAYRHQIRALLAFSGSPVVGDELYGAAPCAELVPGRHALHASYIRYAGVAMEPFEVSSRLPADMLRVIELAR